MRKVLETLEDNGEGVITGWDYNTGEQEAKLDRKMDMLQVAEVDLVTGKAVLPQDLLAGPGVYGQKWIYKLKIKGNVALRPMLALGPIDKTLEWTFLSRAVEKDGVTRPSGKKAAATAESRRLEVLAKTRDRCTLLGLPKDKK